MRAAATAVLGEYQWSNCQCNGYGKDGVRITPHPLYTELGRADEERTCAHRELFSTHFDYEQLHGMREAFNQELSLGDRYFKEKIEAMTERRVTPGKLDRSKVSEVGGNYFVY